MAKLSIKKGSQDVTLLVFIMDSTSTSGAGKTGLTYNTANLVCYYIRPGSAAAQLSLATQTVTGTHTDGGFVEIDATNMPGVYRLDLSDAIVASGAISAVVMLKGATGMAPLTLELELTDNTVKDVYDKVSSLAYDGSGNVKANVQAQDSALDFNSTQKSSITAAVPSATTIRQEMDSNSTKLANLDATMTSRAPASTALSTSVWTSTKAGYLDAAITSRSTLTAQGVWEYATRTLSTFGSLVSDIATAIWSATTRTLSAFGFSVTVGTNNDKTGYSLTSAYDAAKTAASQASVNAIPTNPLLANDTRLNNIDAAISSRLASEDYIEPDNTTISAINAKTTNLPDSPAAVGSQMDLVNSPNATAIAAIQE